MKSKDINKGKESIKVRKKYKPMYLSLILLLVVFFLSFGVGRYPIPIDILLKVLFSKIFSIAKTWPDTVETVIFQVRLPRIIAAILVGASLSVSGAVYQGMFKNSLASPDVLGVLSGAAFGAALAIFLSFNTLGIQLSAFILGIIGVVLVHLISRKMKNDSITTLIIVGVLIGSIFTSLTSLIKYLVDTEDKLPTITFWLMGSFSSVKIVDVKRVFMPIILSMIPLFLLRWRLNLLSLNDDEARTLGLDIKKVRAIVIICSTLMTAASVSISGMIGWIGLVIPNFIRMIIGPDYRILLPTTALLGGTYLLLIDNIARALTTVEIPIGILTSLIGAPFFIFMLLNKERS